MSDMKIRPVIFLYTDAASIDDATRSLMAEAGFLPVKVSDVNSVRLMEPALILDASVEGPLFKSAMEMISEYVAAGNTKYAAIFAAALADHILGKRT